MKKIFTLFSGLLLATGLTAQAESVTVSITDADWNKIAPNTSATLSLNEDGTYTLDNFLDSEQSISFKFEKPGIGDFSHITLTSPTKPFGESEEDKDYVYVLTDGGTPLEGWIWNLNESGIWMEIANPYLYLPDTGVYGYDPATGSQYYASFVVYGDFRVYNWSTEEYEDKEDTWIYVGFWFDEPSSESNTSAETEFTVKTQVYDAEKEEYKWVETGESFKSVLTANENQSITIEDFFRSGSPVTFDFATPQPWKGTAISFPDSEVSEGYEDYPYLLDKDGKQMTCWNIPIDGGEQEPIYNTFVNNSIDNLGTPKSYLYDMLDNDYFLCIYVSGYSKDYDTAPLYQLTAEFNMELKLKGEESAVAGIEVDENAPVEYYNLNGQKVQNPANGIFIRKQGAKATKVIIR